MEHHLLALVGVVVTMFNAAAVPTNEATVVAVAGSAPVAPADDLKPDASTYGRGYSDRGYLPGSGYGVTGYGIIDDRQGYGYDRSGYTGGYYDDYRYSQGAGYRGYDGYGSTGYSGYSGNVGYDGYRSTGYSGYSGNGGYGGYGGNGGISSYYGYRNPYYQGANHVGFGYYKKPGYGNIYDNGVTPSLVTGYRGYTRR